jgi:hypothetical protein
MSNNTAKHAAFETIVSRFGPDTANKFIYSFDLDKLKAGVDYYNAASFGPLTVVEGAAVLCVVKELIQKSTVLPVEESWAEGYADLMAYAYYLDLNLLHRIGNSGPATLLHFLVEAHHIGTCCNGPSNHHHQNPIA